MTFQEYAIGLIAGFSAVALLQCGAQIEPMKPLPAGCEVMAEKVRLQLCPRFTMSLVCSDVGQTNPDPAYCAGPDWTEGRQETGNAWCCNPGEPRYQ